MSTITEPEADPGQAQSLIAGCQGLVRSLAWSIHRKVPRSIELDDLIAYGQVGLAEAARDYNPQRGAFTTYAYYRIRGAIFDGLSRMNWFSRYDYHASRYEYLADEVMKQDAGAPLPDSATAQEQVGWLKSVAGRLAVVYLATASCDGGAQIEDSQTPAPGQRMAGDELRDRLSRLIDALPQQAASLIRSAYFEGCTLQEAGRRLGVSKSWASRLHEKALRQLARALRREGVDEATNPCIL